MEEQGAAVEFARVQRDASTVEGDAVDNTTTVDCSSDDKGRSGGREQMLLNKSGGAATQGTSGNGVPGTMAKRVRCRAAGKKQERRAAQGGVGRVGAQQRKRRRGKTKGNRKKNPLPKTVNWRLPDQDAAIPPYPLVPYNTNRFLMEYHMAEVPATGAAVGRDEFLTNEFSTVYETAKCERLEGLPKQQLIQEYLQLESSHEQLKQRLREEKEEATGNGSKTAGSQQSHLNRAKWESHWRALKERVRRLTAENHELKAELGRMKGGGGGEDDSVDSESDSSVSSISSRSSSRSRSSSSSSSSSGSGSGSCCSSRCSSRDSSGNVLPGRLNSDTEMKGTANDHESEDVAMRVDGQRPGNESNGRERPVNHHHRHRTHRQRRQSHSRSHQQPHSAPSPATLENGHNMEEM